MEQLLQARNALLTSGPHPWHPPTLVSGNIGGVGSNKGSASGVRSSMGLSLGLSSGSALCPLLGNSKPHGMAPTEWRPRPLDFGAERCATRPTTGLQGVAGSTSPLCNSIFTIYY